jgi:hypothetical protein
LEKLKKLLQQKKDETDEKDEIIAILEQNIDKLFNAME